MVSSSWYIYKVNSVGKTRQTGVPLEGVVLVYHVRNNNNNKKKAVQKADFSLLFKIM